jgi:hypothetical protein
MLMTLRKQLLMAFTASISLLLGAVVFALLSLAQVNQQFYQLTHREQVLFEHLSSAYAQGLQAGQALRNILLDPANQRGHDNLKKAQQDLATLLDGAEQLADPAMQPVIAGLKTSNARRNEVIASILTQVNTDIEQAKAIQNHHQHTQPSSRASPIRPTCWRSMPPSRRPGPASRGAALRWWPTRCASWPKMTRIQSGIDDADRLMSEGTAAVQQERQLIVEAGTVIRALDASNSQVREEVTLIVQAINEQGAASEEVSASIEAVAQLSEKYRTELDSSLAALNDTARLAETMKSVTDRFRI